MLRASDTGQNWIARGLFFLGSDNVTVFFSSKAAAVRVQQNFPSTGEVFIGARSHKVGAALRYIKSCARLCGHGEDAETPPT